MSAGIGLSANIPKPACGILEGPIRRPRGKVRLALSVQLAGACVHNNFVCPYYRCYIICFSFQICSNIDRAII